MSQVQLNALNLSSVELRTTYALAAYAALLICAVGGTIVLLGSSWGLVVLAALLMPWVFSRPTEGLWISLAFVMLASLIAPPAGFEFGYGYSPELVYWAGAMCLLLVALLLRYVWGRDKSAACSVFGRVASLPTAFYAFAAVSVFSALVGAARGYAIQNVAKQFYGCVLFCAYFLFALTFTPAEEDIDRVLHYAKKAGVFFALVYITIFSRKCLKRASGKNSQFFPLTREV